MKAADGDASWALNWIPLEDMRELWFWGRWKEPAPDPFSSSVVIICTSRAAAIRYAAGQTHDHYLDDSATPEIRTEDLFDDGTRDADGNRRFRLVTFTQFVEELRTTARSMETRRLTLLVNPRREARQLEADAMFDLPHFLKALDSRSR